MKKITFNFGEETRPVIEDGKKKLSNSIFFEQYEKAFYEINSYIGQLKNIQGNDSFGESHNENINNIFAFIGERGSGKTSCMLSVGNALVNVNEQDDYRNKFIHIKGKKFYTIDLIDPSFFDNKNNILAIVVAKLFKEFEQHSSKRNHCENYDKKRAVVEKFQETQRNLKCLIEGEKLSDDNLDQLIALSAAVDLRKNIKDLVHTYLDYLGSKDAILLLMVDDIDLHTQYSREMVEQIRKYLIQPNIVVLMALKMDQLATVKRLHFTREFEKLLAQDHQRFSLDTIDEMVDKYITKLLPHQQRIFMPEGSDYLSMELHIYDSNKMEKEEGSIIFNSIREAVPMLIFQKTRFLFYNSKEETSKIIPRNLRELRQIVKMLYSMEDYRAYDESKRPEYNKILFKNYLFETWCNNNLNIDGQRIMNEILKQDDVWLLNKKIIKLLNNQYDIKSKASDEEVLKIIESKNPYFNISLGDVLCVINFIESISPDYNDKNLLFIIRTLYSIKLYEYYDEMTDQEIKDKNKNLLPEVFINEGITPLSNYKKIVNGSYINVPYLNLLPTNSKTNIERSYRKVRLNNLNSLVEICLNANKAITDKKESAKEEKEVEEGVECLAESTDLENKIHAIEFMMLMISRYIDTKNADKKNNFTNPDYRLDKEPFYNESLKNRDNACFDIASFFYNIIDIKSTYSRFKKGEEFFNLVESVPNSIYNQIKKKVEERNKTDYSIQKWYSWTCIRNIEILQYLIKFMTYNRPKGADNDLKVLQEFFKLIAEFEVKTYDFTNDKKEHYSIDFCFVEIFIKILDNKEVELNFEELLKLTDPISNQNEKIFINEEDILKRRTDTNNLSSTIIKYIEENYRELIKIQEFSDKLKTFFKEKHVSRKDISINIKLLNEFLKEYYG